MARSVDEWIGRSDDSRPSQSCMERLLEKFGRRCAICSRPLRHGHWDADHIKRLRDGGANRESNLHPVCRVPCHRDKTAAENKAGARDSSVKARHHGYKRRKGNPMPGTKASGWKRKLDGTVERRG